MRWQNFHFVKIVVFWFKLYPNIQKKTQTDWTQDKITYIQANRSNCARVKVVNYGLHRRYYLISVPNVWPEHFTTFRPIWSVSTFHFYFVKTVITSFKFYSNIKKKQTNWRQGKITHIQIDRGRVANYGIHRRSDLISVPYVWPENTTTFRPMWRGHSTYQK